MNSQRRFSRRKFAVGTGLAALGTVAYARWIESGWLGIGQHSVKLSSAGLSQPLRILQLSDLHASSVVPLTFIEKAVRLGLDLKPDLVFLTGDFISGRFDQFDEYAKILQLLSTQHACYATLGNHDGGKWARVRNGYEDTQAVRGLLNNAGVTLLHNRSVEAQVGNNSVRLVGLGDWWAGELAPETAFAGVPQRKGLTLVMSHNPDTKELLRNYAWDMMFCGHTHGGQLQIPLIGTPFAPVRDKRFVKGLHNWNGRWLHITKGVGNLLGVRINCRPEISLITLT
jgi:predicted MPP superfamily phosphohydrolase